MNLFIHTENQKLLWSVISQSILFQNLGNSREEWFRSIIQQFHQNISNLVVTTEVLQKLNKETINYMLDTLKATQLPQQQQPPQPQQKPITQYTPQPQSQQYTPPSLTPSQQYQYNQLPPAPQYNPFNQNPSSQLNNSVNQSNSSYIPQNTNATRDYLSDQKHQELNTQFDNRQLQYTNMLTKPVQKDINFKEGQLDEPISNMNELIKQHMASREEELRKYAPAPILAPILAPIPTSSNNGQPVKNLRIEETLDNRVIENIIEFNLDDTPNHIQESKQVHWAKNEAKNEANQTAESNNQTILNLQLSIYDLKSKVDSIVEIVSELKTFLISKPTVELL